MPYVLNRAGCKRVAQVIYYYTLPIPILTALLLVIPAYDWTRTLDAAPAIAVHGALSFILGGPVLASAIGGPCCFTYTWNEFTRFAHAAWLFLGGVCIVQALGLLVGGPILGSGVVFCPDTAQFYVTLGILLGGVLVVVGLFYFIQALRWLFQWLTENCCVYVETV